MFTIATLLLAGALVTSAPADESASASASQRASASIDDAGLEAISAGADGGVEVFTDQTLSATNSGNSLTADTIRSGDIVFSDGALSGFNGVGNFVLNTGANNNLQGVVSITIVMPAGQ